MAFELPGDIDIPEDIDEQLDEAAYKEAERITKLYEKAKSNWSLERLIADSLVRCYRELYILRGSKSNDDKN